MSSSNPGILSALQHILQRLHDVDTHLDVEAYSIDDETRKNIPEAIDGLVEQLFVRDDGETLELALFVAPHIVSCLHADDPRKHLHPGNFEHFCVALEGVSHFVFLAWRAGLDRPVTALELELQAEVDKFVVSWLLVLAGQAHPAITADSLLHCLFHSFALHQDIPIAEHERYRVASRAAYAVCKSFVQQAGPTPHAHRVVRAARLFYRRGLPEKLQAA